MQYLASFLHFMKIENYCCNFVTQLLSYHSMAVVHALAHLASALTHLASALAHLASALTHLAFALVIDRC
jgi:hypothetical protein